MTLKYIDLVLLDIKSINPLIYKDLTKVDLVPTLNFAEYLSDNIDTYQISQII